MMDRRGLRTRRGRGAANWIGRAALCAAALGAAPPAQAQSTVLQGYPYLEGLSVASRPGGVGGNDLVVLGAGGGIVFLEHDLTAPLEIDLSTAFQNDREDTLGASFDIALGDGFAYVAAFRRGLVVFERITSGTTTSWQRNIVPGTEGARSVAIQDAGNGRTLVVIGTYEDTNPLAVAPAGRVMILEHDRNAPLSASNPAVLRDEAVSAGVFAVAASQAIAGSISVPAGSTPLTVLFGGSCLTTTGGQPAPLQRRDLAYTQGAPSTLALVSGAAWGGDVRPTINQVWGRFVRDIVIDEGMQRAYAACYHHGVYAFDVASVLAQDTRVGWPLSLPDASSPADPVPGRVNSLALDPAPIGVPARLVVGWGPSVIVEWQYLGDCAHGACNELDVPKGEPDLDSYVSTYALDATGHVAHTNGVALMEAGAAIDPAHQGATRAIAVRRDPTPGLNVLYVDVAYGARGYQLLRLKSDDSGAYSLDLEDEFGKGNPPRLPMNTFDDLTIQTRPNGNEVRRTLYVGTELGVAAFDISSPAQLKLREAYSWISQIPSIGVHALAESNGFHRLYSTNSAGRGSSPTPCVAPLGPAGGGLKGFDISDRLSPKNPPNTNSAAKIHKGGFGYMLRVAPGFDAAQSPADHSHYLYSVQEARPWGTGGHEVRFSVRIWDVGTQSAPRDQVNLCRPKSFAAGNDPACTSECPSCEVCSASNCNPQTPADPDPLCLSYFMTTSLPSLTAEMALEGIEILPVAASGGQPAYNVVYVLYGQKPLANGDPLTGPAGLLVLKHTETGGVHALAYETHVQAWGMVDSEHRPVRLAYDAEDQWLYGAWTTGGVAVFDVSTPLAPALLAVQTIDSVSATGLRRAPLHALPGPRGTGGDRYAYVALMNDGIDVYRMVPSGGGSLPYNLVRATGSPMRFQTLGLAHDPSDASRRTLYTVQARCGLDRVRFDAGQFP